MRVKSLYVGLLTVALAGSAFSQETPQPLTIGDPAPTFKPVGWVKGTPVPEFEKGKVYVVEFWATWCGPCLQSMPHLSDMADKMKGKVDFIGVNTWDRNEEGEKEPGNAKHEERIKKFVAENGQKMRYNVAMDDERDTIANTWMRAAGQNGIPCAFIVNQEGQIAWIGHPMSMEEPVEQVYNGTFDLQAFKTKFDEEAAQARAEMKLSQDAQAAAKEGDMEKFEGLIAKFDGEKSDAVVRGASIASRANPEFAMKYVEANMDKVTVDPVDWCNILGSIAQSTKDEATKTKALAMSADCAEKANPEMKGVAYAFHARSLSQTGRKDEAKQYIAKARAAVKDYPEQGRESLSKFIDGIEKSIQ
ncbi:MAG: TlpA family protein disulfide reductase [Fimbriimonadaceae bacterium]|nr:TlpA family protein disulfide reductase [Fimbriimonadaceae bacterium]QYK55988.1 MAG: TlpA family protein disulfide reductase [Fimbriimonadaceae bacterium]